MKLRIAFGLGSVTLQLQVHSSSSLLRIAFGLGSVTLEYTRYDLNVRCGLLSDSDRLH